MSVCVCVVSCIGTETIMLLGDRQEKNLELNSNRWRPAETSRAFAVSAAALTHNQTSAMQEESSGSKQTQ